MVQLRWQGDGPMLDLLGRMADELAARLRRIGGTEQVVLFGEPTEEIRVEIDHGQLAALGMSLPQAAQRIAAADSKSSAGTLTTATQQLPVEVSVVVSAPLIALRKSCCKPLPDAACMSAISPASPVALACQNSAPPGIMASAAFSSLHVSKIISSSIPDLLPTARVAEFAEQQGSPIAVDIVFDQREYTADRLLGLGNNMLAGMAIIVLAIAVLMGWRAATVIGLALPLTIGSLMIVFAIIGVPLHQMSLFGTLIALGLLIDNAIVVVDEVRKRMSEGESGGQAVAGTVKHLRGLLSSSTATTVLSFMPIALLPGPAGEFIGTIAVAVIVALLSSLLIALFLLPAMTAKFAPPLRNAERKKQWWYDGIRCAGLARLSERVLRLALRHPKVSDVVGVCDCSHWLQPRPRAGSQFLPAADRDMFQIRVWMVPGTAMTQTVNGVVERLDAYLARNDQIIARQWHAPVFRRCITIKSWMLTKRQTTRKVMTVDSPATTSCWYRHYSRNWTNNSQMRRSWSACSHRVRQCQRQ